MDPEPGPFHCDVAVVIPVFKQPGFLPEALNSILTQRTTLKIGAVIVDDGCPMPGTREAGMAFARRYPGRVFYLRRRNGGLSAARNTGIDFALAAWPECQAIYLLDADNRLHPDFIQRAWDVLASSPPEVGWAYPDIDMFGFEMNFTVRGEYSHFLHLVENYCEAGSLARRSVFELGLRFDEAMRQGFEDWEFWLNCARHGFIGRHVPQSGFQYRRRAESMLTGSERVRDSILAYMRKKHAKELRPSALLALEQREVPRFAIFTGLDEDVRLAVDPRPGQGRELSPEACDEMFVTCTQQPKAQHFPGYCCFTTTPVLQLLEQAKLLPGLFWMAQLMLAEYHVVVIETVVSEGEHLGLEPLFNRTVTGRDVVAAPMVLGNSQLLRNVASDPSASWFGSIESEQPHPKLGMIRVTLPASAGQVPPLPERHVSGMMLDMLARWRAKLQQRAPRPTEWREDARRYRTSATESYMLLSNLGTVMPFVAPDDRRDIGFILPLCAFGGVEKVVLNYARVLKDAGWRPHLFITAAQTAQLTEEQRDIFHSVNFLTGRGEEAADWNNLHLGSGTSAFNQQNQDAIGLLCTMAAVLNTHSMAGHGLVAGLRRQGVKTFLGLHLVERSQLGQPMGNPHIGLAYEHAYDGFLVISRQLRDWCAGQAVPREKLHIIRNAPSYPTHETRQRRAMAQRPRRQGPLRALFLGRLDEQKGIDRLAQMILRTQGHSVDWRVVGKAVVGDAAADLAAAGIAPEPAVMHPHELDRLYAWADVVVLPSRFEGVPLTILEAQRMGCTVIATDVGAVAEIIEDGEDGFLVSSSASEREIVDTFVQILDRLAANRRELNAVAQTAADRVSATTWAGNMGSFLHYLETLLEEKA
ncbi:glycosyltransferase [Pseudoroseomonas ludipueritiae]|uniref:Glycosyltransferase n=1 Tax=Pseudoroseomonas ludipueritiae TaxID=198093 RepID=A0ABR7RA13_9PROT|nr:glycosyltransferase [Pseudoroseomonas ludipueritiae]MBC9178595.1 glycosyltransferase [Pseudoroseomonas ludipueritiae]